MPRLLSISTIVAGLQASLALGQLRARRSQLLLGTHAAALGLPGGGLRRGDLLLCPGDVGLELDPPAPGRLANLPPRATPAPGAVGVRANASSNLRIPFENRSCPSAFDCQVNVKS